MTDGRFRALLRAPTPGFLKVVTQIRGLARVWAEFVGAVVLISLFFGPIAILGFVATILTIALPIGALALWGAALDKELGWTERGEGD